MEPEMLHWIITGLMGVVVGIFKFAAGRVEKDFEALKQEVHVLRDTRVHKDDLRDFKAEIRELFVEIKADIKEIKNSK